MNIEYYLNMIVSTLSKTNENSDIDNTYYCGCEKLLNS